MWTAQSVRPSSPYSRVPSSGSTIQTRSASRRRLVVDALLGEHRVVGPLGREPLHQQLVRVGVAGGAQGRRVGEAHRLAQAEQQLARLGGQGERELVVGDHVGHPATAVWECRPRAPYLGGQ